MKKKKEKRGEFQVVLFVCLKSVIRSPKKYLIYLHNSYNCHFSELSFLQHFTSGNDLSFKKKNSNFLPLWDPTNNFSSNFHIPSTIQFIVSFQLTIFLFHFLVTIKHQTCKNSAARKFFIWNLDFNLPTITIQATK